MVSAAIIRAALCILHLVPALSPLKVLFINRLLSDEQVQSMLDSQASSILEIDLTRAARLARLVCRNPLASG